MKKILVLLMLLLLPVAVMADEPQTTDPATQTEYTTEQIDNVENKPQETQTTAPQTNSNAMKENTDTFTNTGNTMVNQAVNGEVTIEDLGNKILNKLYQIANLLKQIAAPISIITFVVGAIMMVLGALGKRDGMKGGIIVCVLSVIMYAICMYSDQIIIAVSRWMVS